MKESADENIGGLFSLPDLYRLAGHAGKGPADLYQLICISGYDTIFLCIQADRRQLLLAFLSQIPWEIFEFAEVQDEPNYICNGK